MPQLRSSESTLSIAYNLSLDGEPTRIYWVSIISTNQIANVWRAAPPNSVLVVPLQPPAMAVALVRGLIQLPEYIVSQTGLSPREAHLLATIAPLLTRMTLPEDILARAVKWQKSAEYDTWLATHSRSLPIETT